MLGLFKQALFHQPVEAWRYGPVIPDIYHRVKIHGNKPISKPMGFRKPEFDEYELDLIRQVLDIYGGHTGGQLSALTHKPGSPWHKTWHKEGMNSIIRNDVNMEHFSKLAEDEE